MEADYLNTKNRNLIPKKSQAGTFVNRPGDYAGGMIISSKKGKKTKKKGKVHGEMETDYLAEKKIFSRKKFRTKAKDMDYSTKTKKKMVGEIGGEMEVEI